MEGRLHQAMEANQVDEGNPTGAGGGRQVRVRRVWHDGRSQGHVLGVVLEPQVNPNTQPCGNAHLVNPIGGKTGSIPVFTFL